MAIHSVRHLVPVALAVALTVSLLALVEPAAAAAPANDDFGNATVIAGASGSVNGTTVDAWNEADEPTAFRQRTIW